MEITARTIEIYKDSQEGSPYLDWLTSLKDRKAQAVIATRIARLTLGNLGDCKAIKGCENLFEARIFVGPGYRIYFGLDGDTIVLLLNGGDKSTQRKDIEKAKHYWSDYALQKEQQKEKNDEQAHQQLP